MDEGVELLHAVVHFPERHAFDVCDVSGRHTEDFCDVLLRHYRFETICETLADFQSLAVNPNAFSGATHFDPRELATALKATAQRNCLVLESFLRTAFVVGISINDFVSLIIFQTVTGFNLQPQHFFLSEKVASFSDKILQFFRITPSSSLLPVGFQPCSTAFRRRFWAAAFAGVVDLAFTPFGVETRTLPFPVFRIVTGIAVKQSLVWSD
jgi:hypothetical protein